MGYRNYIGSISKRDYNKIKSIKSKEEFFTFFNEEDYVSVRDFVKEVYEFGKDCDFTKEGLSKPFFKSKELNTEYNYEGELCIVSKPFLAAIITDYTENVKNYYLDLKTAFTKEVLNGEAPLNKEGLEKVNYHLNSFSSEWLFLTPYDLENGEEITTSWKYEYIIFELVRIYKTFDWKKKHLVYYGL